MIKSMQPCAAYQPTLPLKVEMSGSCMLNVHVTNMMHWLTLPPPVVQVFLPLLMNHFTEVELRQLTSMVLELHHLLPQQPQQNAGERRVLGNSTRSLSLVWFSLRMYSDELEGDRPKSTTGAWNDCILLFITYIIEACLALLSNTCILLCHIVYCTAECQSTLQ